MKNKDLNFDDEYLKGALRLFLDGGDISVSFLQRKLTVGYMRALKLINTLEFMELISPVDENKKRKLLLTENQEREFFGENLGTTSNECFDNDAFHKMIEDFKKISQKQNELLIKDSAMEKNETGEISTKQGCDSPFDDLEIKSKGKNKTYEKTQIDSETHEKTYQFVEKYGLNDVKMLDEDGKSISKENKNWLFETLNDAINSNDIGMAGHYFCPKLSFEEFNKILFELKNNKARFRLYSGKDEKEIDDIKIKDNESFLNAKSVWVFVKVNDIMVSDFKKLISRVETNDKDVEISFVIDNELEYKYQIGILMI